MENFTLKGFSWDTRGLSHNETSHKKNLFEKLIQPFIHYFTLSLPLPFLPPVHFMGEAFGISSPEGGGGVGTRVLRQSSQWAFKASPSSQPHSLRVVWAHRVSAAHQLGPSGWRLEAPIDACAKCAPSPADGPCGSLQAICVVAATAAGCVCLSQVRNPTHVV